jgi:hypothetical protein
VSVADILRAQTGNETMRGVEPPIEHRDVTTIMGLIVDIRDEVVATRQLLEDDDGEEEAEEADA